MVSKIKFPKTRKEFEDRLELAYIQGFLDCNNNKELIEIYTKQSKPLFKLLALLSKNYIHKITDLEVSMYIAKLSCEPDEAERYLQAVLR